MKTRIPFIAAGLAAACNAALAAEYGTVISSTPVTAQVAVPQQQCQYQQQLVQPRTSGGGAVLGAVVGGVLGNSLGGGFGRAAATGLGVVAGAALGNQVEANSTAPAEQAVRSCQTVTTYENRLVGYDVVYDYNGRRYTTRLAQDPGARIALDVSVTPAGSTATVAPALSGPPPVVAVAPPLVYAPAPAYGYYGYADAPVVVAPSVAIGGYWDRGYLDRGYLDRGYWGGDHGRHGDRR